MVELSKALTSIAEVLPRLRLDGILYPTEYMKDATSRVYAHIMLFLQKAVKWYTLGPARRAVSTFLKPYSLSYMDTVEQIRTCTGYIDAVASAAARAEVRDINITIEEQSDKLAGVDQILRAMRNELKEVQASAQRSEAQLLQIWQVATSQ